MNSSFNNRKQFKHNDLTSEQRNKLEQARAVIEEQNRMLQLRNESLESEVANRNQELLEYAKQLEQFAFISAHNLRGPVARILGLGQILEASTNPLEKRSIIDKLIRSTKELDSVVRDLVRILEIRTQNDHPLVELNLCSEVLLIEKCLAEEIHHAQATIVKDFSTACTLTTIEPYFKSILFNLLSNAIKFRKPGQGVEIRLSSVVQDGLFCLAIRDNGLGIDLSQYGDRLFSLYGRFHPDVKGRGLGLYLVKTQVDALRGIVEVESRINEGSTFRIYLKNLL